MSKILSVGFSMRYGNCSYQEEVDSIVKRHVVNPDHNFSESPVPYEVQALCELLWTDERKSAWEDRKKYSSMTPEERKQAGYS